MLSTYETSSEDANECKRVLLEYVKNIKSNDETFNIATLSTIAKDLRQLAKTHDQTINRVDSIQKASKKICETIKKDIRERDADDESFLNCEIYSENFNNVLDEYEAANNQQSRWFTYKEIQRILSKDQANIEEIVEEEQEFIVPLDPFTRQPIISAVRNAKCKHLYDKTGIHTYIDQRASNKKRAQCPHIGCSNKNVTHEDIVDDEQMNAKIEQSKQKGLRRQQQFQQPECKLEKE